MSNYAELEIDIMNALKDYTNEVCEDVAKIIDDVSDEAIEKLKETSPRISGKGGGGKHYYKGWSKKAEYDDKKGNKRVKIYNRAKGQITSLLEFGHAKRGGKGRVDGKPHIKAVENWVKSELPKRIEEAIKK